MESIGTTSIIRIIFPEKLWLGQLSRQFPNFQFEIKSFIPISQDPIIGNNLITITGTNPSQLLVNLQNHPSLVSYFVLEESPTQITLNTQTKDQFLLKAIIKNYILIKFPVKIDNGQANFTVTSSRENINQFMQDLNEVGIEADLKSIGHYTENENENVLTPRQNIIYRQARESGYYDTPRRISLSELADQLKISKSTLSTMLQRVHKKLLGNK